MDATTELIERYADLSERLEQLNKMKAELQEKAITEEVRKVLLDIDGEFDPLILTVNDELATTKEKIEKQVLEYAKDNPNAEDKSIKGTRYMAVWSKGREGGWDSDKLKGYALAHPEILGAKKVDGEPTVSFRKVK